MLQFRDLNIVRTFAYKLKNVDQSDVFKNTHQKKSFAVILVIK